MTAEKLEGIEGARTEIKTTWEATKLVPKVEDNVSKILNNTPEVSDDQKMVNILNKLDWDLKAAQEQYEALYGKSYGNIQGILMNIEFSGTEGLHPNTIELQTLFSGLQGSELSVENTVLFRGLQSIFMEKSPETQARMLWFFELVNDYVISKSNDLSIHTNPLKNVLFSEKNISYEDWIAGIFLNFDKNESGMVALSESIRSAEAPQIGLKQFIRHIFDTKPEVLDEEDRTWLQVLYVQWPDEQATNKPNTISNPDKKERDRIAKTYLLAESVHGTTSSEEISAAKRFRSSLLSN